MKDKEQLYKLTEEGGGIISILGRYLTKHEIACPNPKCGDSSRRLAFANQCPKCGWHFPTTVYDLPEFKDE